MELWHLGLCLLCAVMGAALGVIVDIDSREKEADKAYHVGYRDGWLAMAEKIGLEDEEDDG